jgi:Domain of unknown function (DUF4190)
MFCFRCGVSMPDDAQVCPQCAAPVANAPAPNARQSPAPPASTSPWLNVPPAQGQYPGQGQYPPAQYAGQYYAQQPPTDGKATASLVFGIISLIPCIAILAGIPAIILGHLSRGEVRRSMGRLSGAGMAQAGLIMGYISIGITALMVSAVVLPNIWRARITANESAAASTVRTINTSQVTYVTTYAEAGYARDLATLGPGPSGSCDNAKGTAEHACLVDNSIGNPSCKAGSWCSKSGYKFSMSAETSCPDQTDAKPGAGCNYVIVATPVSDATGRKSYCSTADAIIRYKYGFPLSHPISVDECGRWSPIM